MQGAVKAVIFDMDGVLIDSEPLWRRAMIKSFSEAGIPFTEADCRKTTGLRIGEVVRFWLNLHPHLGISALKLERNILDELIGLINSEGKAMDGVNHLLDYCQRKQIPVGLATSSSNELMACVLRKLSLSAVFSSTVSAEFLKYGKPHPEVFLQCAEQLQVNPSDCLVMEDSVNGVIAARAAQMQVMAVPDNDHFTLPGFAIAHHLCKNMTEALLVLKHLVEAKLVS